MHFRQEELAFRISLLALLVSPWATHHQAQVSMGAQRLPLSQSSMQYDAYITACHFSGAMLWRPRLLRAARLSEHSVFSMVGSIRYRSMTCTLGVMRWHGYRKVA